MCGIVGFITSNKHARVAQNKFFSQALVLDVLRGFDSTGMFVVPSDVNVPVHYHKSADHAIDFTRHTEFHNYFGKDSAQMGEELWAAVGHNRAATIGSVTAENAHPFAEEYVTLVHNGTLISPNKLPLPMKDMEDVTVDSNALARNFSQFDAAKEVIPKIDGSFALVWHDLRDDSLNFARNHNRPLWFAKNRANNTLYFMSEKHMLIAVLERNNIQYSTPFTLPVGEMWTFYPNKGIEHKVTKVQLHKPAVSSGSWYGRGSYYGKSNYSTPKVVHTNLTPKKGKTKASYLNEVPVYKRDDKKILINKVWKPVPNIVQEALFDEYEILEDTVFGFIPTSVVWGGYKEGRISVRGHLPRFDCSGIIHCLTHDFWDKYSGEMWRVRGIGCFRNFHGSKLHLICALAEHPGDLRVGPGEDGDDESYYDQTASTSPEIVTQDSLAQEQEDKDTKNSIIEALKSGCICCGTAIHPASASSVIWVNGDVGKKDPVCLMCQEEYVAEFGEAVFLPYKA
jgi:hypothetical protein